MKRRMEGVVCLLAFIVAQGEAQVFYQPEQVHLAYGAKPSHMVVTWVTLNDTKNPSCVEYGIDSLALVVKNSRQKEFVDGGAEKRSIFIHSVTMTHLKAGQRYMYHVGGPLGWSDIFYFQAMPTNPDFSARFALFGDMGNENAVSLSNLQELAQGGYIDAILHVGDFAYDMDTDNARYGDVFMNQVQPIAAYVPYMVCPGNHEAAYNFSNYRNRFSMPGGSGDSLFYSFNIGKAHIISFSTEVYYYYSYSKFGWLQIINQYKWLENDLRAANTAEARAERPWIIVQGHKPMYCSNADGPTEQCNNLKGNLLRYGIPALHAFSIEDLFYKYGVDLQFYAHEHSYERLWPVYNMTVCNGTESAYDDPRAPVHIITGSAGNREGQTEFNPKPYPWSATHSDDYGYTLMTIVNATLIDLKQISMDQGGKIIDHVTITKKGSSPAFDCHLQH